jgi:hypothetical protein
MRSQTDLATVASLVEVGLNDCEISRRTGIPRTTIGHWRRAERRPSAPHACSACGHAEHDFTALPARDYAYLLGAYLGDGHVARYPRGVFRLTVYCALMHINIAWWIALATERVIGRRASIRPDPRDNLIYVQSYSKQWPCLLPQHGPGRKHERRIALADWQQRIVDAHPDQLARGLIHSDGSRHLNTIRTPGRTYEYVRYEFTNRSDDIKRIFCDACDALGVEWRVMNRDAISIARRASVAKLEAFIGPKR